MTAKSLDAIAARYAVAVTPLMQELIDSESADGPIAAQFVPDIKELDQSLSENPDPIGDAEHSPVKGIVHRYPDRVLLTPIHMCPVYCRFCFRREVVGGGNALSATELDTALNYVRQCREVWEVILSGGDPLLLSPRRLDAILTTLRTIDHVKVVRIHTRVPLVDPDRVSDHLLDVLKRAAPLFVVLHANHRAEFTPQGAAAVAQLVDSGIPMLGQTVLLKGVNDDPDSLEQLLRQMVENRIKPYYLHQADRAPGTRHFRTSIEHGRELATALRGRVSGICQPTYVLDIPGGHGKSPIGPDYASRLGENEWQVEDYNGRRHRVRCE